MKAGKIELLMIRRLLVKKSWFPSPDPTASEFYSKFGHGKLFLSFAGTRLHAPFRVVFGFGPDRLILFKT